MLVRSSSDSATLSASRRWRTGGLRVTILAVCRGCWSVTEHTDSHSLFKLRPVFYAHQFNQQCNSLASTCLNTLTVSFVSILQDDVIGASSELSLSCISLSGEYRLTLRQMIFIILTNLKMCETSHITTHIMTDFLVLFL